MADEIAGAEPSSDAAETIVVSGVRAFRPGALQDGAIIRTEVFDQSAVDRVHAVNINELLDKNPGISVQLECSICNVRNISLNNLPGRFTTLMIDGVPLFSSLSSAYGLDSVPVRGIERVEVSRGAGASLIAPEAISGVVNIVTRKPLGTEIELLADAGRFGWVNLQGYAATDLPGGGGVSISANHQRHDSVDATGSGISQFTGFNRTIVGAAAFVDVGAFDMRLRADYVHEKRGGGALGSDYAAIKADQTGNPFDWSRGPNASPSPEGWFAPDGSGFIPYDSGRGGFSEIIFTDRFQALGSAERRLGDNVLRFAAGYAWNKLDSFYELSTYVATGEQLYGEASYRLALPRGGATLGFNYRSETLRSRGVTSAGVSNDGLDDYSYQTPGLFGQLYQQLFDDALEINLSARLDFHNVFGTIFSPRANALLHHTDNLSSRVAIGRGFRAPTSFFEQDHGILDTDYVRREIDRPERSTNISYALNYSDRIWNVTAGYNWNRITNFAILDPSQIDDQGRPFTLFTSADTPVTVQGIDLSAVLAPLPNLELTLGAEKYWFDFETGVLPFARPDLRIIGSIDWDPIERLHLFTRLVFTGRQNLEPFHGADRFNLDGSPKPLTAPAFATWDLRAELFLLPDQLSLYAGIDNITDFNQADRDGFLWLDASGAIDVTHIWGPNRGRFVYGGLKFSY